MKKTAIPSGQLLNGAPITSLALVTGRTYADLDGDGLIDSILVLESKDDIYLLKLKRGNIVSDAKFLNLLDGIKYGSIDDNHNWITKL